jgi:dCMP deaminase
MYKSDEEHYQLIKRKFINKCDTIEEFRESLKPYEFDNRQLVRPSFDTYFMRLTELCAQRSNCMKRGNGAIIVKD